MPLFGSSGAPKFQLTRRMIIVLAVFGVLLVAIIILAVVLAVNANQANKRAGVAAALPTATMSVAEVTLPSAPDTAPPGHTAGLAEVTSVPIPPTQRVAVVPTAAATAVPAPTVQEGGGVVAPPPGGGVGTASTTPAAGGGETAALPASSSGLPYLIPVGALLLAAIVWWRWRRARAHGS